MVVKLKWARRWARKQVSGARGAGRPHLFMSPFDSELVKHASADAMGVCDLSGSGRESRSRTQWSSLYFQLVLPPLISDLIYPVPRHALLRDISESLKE
eukprot:SAG11_NODE_1299_length_5264_cov_5.517715_1_plen_99_part_00